MLTVILNIILRKKFTITESQNLIKLLEDKLEETEAKFISESNKVKVEKEMFETKIKVLEDSNKAFIVNTQAPDDLPAKFGKSVENSSKCNGSEKHQDPDETQNIFIPTFQLKNFHALSSKLGGISTL